MLHKNIPIVKQLTKKAEPRPTNDMKKPTTLADNQPAPTGVALQRLVRPRQWNQKGFIVVSDGNGLPMIHEWHPAQWMAESRVRQLTALLPAHLCKNMTVEKAMMKFEWPRQYGW
jgi:hypothetical protein